MASTFQRMVTRDILAMTNFLPALRISKGLRSFMPLCARLVALWTTGCDGNSEQPVVPNEPGPEEPIDMMMEEAPELAPSILEPPKGPLTGQAPMRLLTRVEYDLTVSDLLGFASPEAQIFPPESGVRYARRGASGRGAGGAPVSAVFVPNRALRAIAHGRSPARRRHDR